MIWESNLNQYKLCFGPNNQKNVLVMCKTSISTVSLGSKVLFRGRCFFVLLLYRKKTSLSISLPSSKLTISLILFTKHDISNIADPSSTQYIYHIWTSSWTLLIIESLWLSGRTSECRIWWSEVQFLIGAQNFFFVPCLYKMKKTSFSVALPSSKTYHLFLFYLQIFFFRLDFE